MLHHLRLAVAVVTLVIAAGTIPGPIAAQDQATAVYVVQMDDDPVIAYSRDAQGQAATQPEPREKIDPDSPAVAGYAGYLDARHDAALRRVGGRKLYAYRYAFNGFAARLTEAQAEALKRTPGVLNVTRDELVNVATSHTPAFLGLSDPGGLWHELAGPERAGEDIIIGVIDSGIWPESLSFTDRESRRGVPSAHGRVVYDHMRRWRRRCEAGEQFSTNDCNNKLIGARYFNAAWGGDAGLKAQRPWEFASPRDYNGHGTHTAATAGGNYGVPTDGPAAVFKAVSGMAPRARIAAYKALWSTQDGSQASGFTSDLVAAIDRAVADGVDVINYSVEGTRTNYAEPVQLAFFNAAASGIFVAASAGNSGPGAFTVAHPSPWVTTVAAGTHNRSGEGSVTLGGNSYEGGSLASTPVTAPVIDAAAAGLPGANPTSVRLCFTESDAGGVPVLDPAKVAGKIVVCDRGVNARVNKSLAVRNAGGVGMILLNTNPAESVNADFHFVPSVHLPSANAAAVKAYAATMGPGTINVATIVFDVPAPQTASFSSRGPALAGEILKPDVMAPGQDILAAVAPPGNAGLNFSMYSGTSMSAPHVAGIAALLMQRHKRWSPMMIKSALMTTGTDIVDATATPANPNSALTIIQQGAGHIAPNDAAHPGLVFDSDPRDWLAFLCGSTNAVNPRLCRRLDRKRSLDPSDLNTPSIAIYDLTGIQKVTRTVTNVSGSTSIYTPKVTGLTGFDVSVKPEALRLRPGQSRSFTVTFKRTTAAFNSFGGGQLTWSDGNHTVRIPMLVAAVAVNAPAEVTSNGAPINYNVTFGYTGPFGATARGLIPATLRPGSVEDDPEDDFDPTDPGASEGVTSFAVTIPPGTTYARFALFDDEVTPASDLDLYVTNSAGALVAFSGTEASNETASISSPAAGEYTVWVHGFDVPAPGTASFTLHQWLLGTASAGNITVTAPSMATIAGPGTINLTFSGLTPGTKYLGSVPYNNGTDFIGVPTIVSVEP